MPKITGDSIAEHVAAQETAVIGATVALFAERGAVNVTMADIAGEVGLARTSVYRYFPTKGAIVARWFETAIKPIIESGNRIAADDADPQLRLGRWVEAQLTFLAHDEHQAMIAAARDLDDMPEDVRLSIGARHRELYASLRRILGELSGPVDDAVVEARVFMITGLLAGFGDLLDTGMNEARCRAEMQRVARCIAG
ncbi:MAG: TetR/AcrR family transcriptional regulator [Candidatus Microthrix parvicella]|jgi:AcrR family transcriptional regulator|nr:TetR/AcrR family transcriptional regulator [Candidatus Microthrix parvicella]HBX10690.1 hypothetical protein [Candidatus Microthrix parvicella]